MPAADRVYNVLFLCTGNSARSILGEALLNHVGGGRFRGYSAGSMPKGQVHPMTLKVLDEHGIATEGLRSKAWDEFAVPGAPKMDFIFTVCDNAAGEACPIWPGQPASAHWGIEDPAAVAGPEFKQHAAFEEALGFMRNRIAAFVNLPLESIDHLTLTSKLRGIGAMEGSTSKAAGAAMTLARRLAAEGLGTGLLVATVVGSGIMAERLTDDVALALLGNTLPTGAILFVLISILGPISGAHFNPVVSLVVALRRELSWGDTARYVAVQVLSGIAGTWLAHLMFELPVLQVSAHVRTGSAQWLSEGIASLGLIVVILGGVRVQKSAVPALVGLYITAAYWFTASTSFANPAVTIARALTDTFSGIRPVDAPAFIVAQVVGALAALVLANWMFADQRLRVE